MSIRSILFRRARTSGVVVDSFVIARDSHTRRHRDGDAGAPRRIARNTGHAHNPDRTARREPGERQKHPGPRVSYNDDARRRSPARGR